jgi:peptidyl-prolyl cis-trans isomerase B (cyclophilin B)
MKSTLWKILLALTLLILLIFSNDKLNKNNTTKEKNMLTGKHSVLITIQNYGEILAELDADIAPITVTNFIKLVNNKFYDGLTFHRIMKGFMIQGGDPKGNGTGGSSETIKGEFTSNGVNNSISHLRGTISMARAQDNNSASSQFFIVHQDSTFLDGEYAGFGKVISGMEVVDMIATTVPVTDDNGSTLKENQPIITSIIVKD